MKDVEENIINSVVDKVDIVSIKIKRRKNREVENERVGYLSIKFNDREYNIYMDLWKVGKNSYYIYNDDFECIHLSLDCIAHKKLDNNIFIQDVNRGLLLAQSDFASNIDINFLLNQTLTRIENRIEIRLEEQFSKKEEEIA